MPDDDLPPPVDPNAEQSKTPLPLNQTKEAGHKPATDTSIDNSIKETTDKETIERTGIVETLDATVGDENTAPSLDRTFTYDQDKSRDATRSYITYWLLALLTIVVVGSFVLLAVLRILNFENLKSIIELVFGPIVALVSAATGFYFGAQQAPKK